MQAVPLLTGGLIHTYLIKKQGIFSSLCLALKNAALISELKNSFTCLKVLIFPTLLPCPIEVLVPSTDFALAVYQSIHLLLVKQRRQFFMKLLKCMFEVDSSSESRRLGQSV